MEEENKENITEDNKEIITPTEIKIGDEEKADEQGENTKGLSKSFIEHQWKPGQSGNPKGRPKFSLVGILKDLLQEIPEGQKETEAVRLMRIALDKALEGDGQMLRDIINRTDGMPRQKIGFDTEDAVTKISIEIIKPKEDGTKDAEHSSLPESSEGIPRKEE